MKARANLSGRFSRGAAMKLGLGIPLLLLAWACWVVALAGVSIVRHQAKTNSVFGGIDFTWFVIAGSGFTLLLALLHVAGAGVTSRHLATAGVTGLLAVFTTLTALETQKWDTIRKVTPYSTKLGKGAVTAFAGFLSLATLNGLLILVLGHTPAAAGTATTNPQVVHQNPVGTADTGYPQAHHNGTTTAV